jgi:hypothetical protein
MVGKLVSDELEGIAHGPSGVLSWHMPSGTNKNHEKPQSAWLVPQPRFGTEHFLIKAYSITAKN